MLVHIDPADTYISKSTFNKLVGDSFENHLTPQLTSLSENNSSLLKEKECSQHGSAQCWKFVSTKLADFLFVQTCRPLKNGRISKAKIELPDSISIQITEESDPTEYKLLGVIEHHLDEVNFKNTGKTSGHYTTLLTEGNGSGKWFYISDSISEERDNIIHSSTSTLLVFRKSKVSNKKSVGEKKIVSKERGPTCPKLGDAMNQIHRIKETVLNNE